MNVESYIRDHRYPEGFEDMFQLSDGTPLSAADALAYLHTEKARGHVVIPCSAECGNPCDQRGCTGFDYSGRGCPGRDCGPANE